MRVAMWPRRSFTRSARYFSKRVMRLTATPHAIAAGVGAGAFASFLPYLGFHFLIAMGIAWFLRGSLLASMLGTAIGNPLTFPIIWAAGLATGREILQMTGPHAAEQMRIGELLAQGDLLNLWGPLVYPMTVGGAALGLVVGVVSYVITRWAVAGFQARRRKRQNTPPDGSAGFGAGGAAAS